MGRSALRRPPHLATYDRRERAISTRVTPPVLHRVAVASVTNSDLWGQKTAVLRALWGTTCLSRAKEIVFSALSKGHSISPVMHTRYERLLRLARVARRPGATQLFTRAIWASGGRPPMTGPVGSAVQTAAALTWCSREGLWCQDHPKQEYPLHLVQGPRRQIQHLVHDILSCYAQRRRGVAPRHVQGPGGRRRRPCLLRVMRVASTELKKLLFCHLVAGALWMVEHVSGHRMRNH